MCCNSICQKKTKTFLKTINFLIAMEGVIVNFRGSRRVKKGNHMIIQVNDADSKEKASELVGKKVMWKTSAGKVINGKIASAHGNSGALRVIFETGMPGQSIGTKVNIE